MLLATTFLVASWDAGVTRVAAQDQPLPADARDSNAQAVTLDTINVQGDSGRTEGYLATSTSVATKTNTPLINIPQSITVVTKDFIRDQGFSSLTETLCSGRCTSPG
jgi:catecholate siderophore receptor